MADFGAIWTPAALGNYDASRLPVDLIVVHHTACPLSAAQARFDTPGAQVSAHFIVAQDGKVYETVPIGDTAYDTGDYRTNERSVGIEHESGPVGQDFFTDVQYAASSALIRAVADHFGFPVDEAHVWPHNRVVPTTCPGVLDIPRLIAGPKEEVPLFELYHNGTTRTVGDVTPQSIWLVNSDGLRRPIVPDEWQVYQQMGYPLKELAPEYIAELRRAVDVGAMKSEVDALAAHPAVAADSGLAAQVAALSKHLGVGQA